MKKFGEIKKDLEKQKKEKSQERSEKDKEYHLAWKASDVEFLSKNKKNLKEDASTFHSPLKEHQFSDESVSNHANHEGSFKKDHRDAIEDYKTSSSGSANDTLRDKMYHVGDKIYAGSREHSRIKSLDHVTSSKTKEDMHLYRGFGKTGRSQFESKSVGDSYVDHGYTGLTTKPKIALSFGAEKVTRDEGKHHHIAQIHVPAGTKGHYLDHTGNKYSTEGEFLLHRGSQFEITGRSKHLEKDSRGNPMVVHVTHMRVTGQNPKNVVKEE